MVQEEQNPLINIEELKNRYYDHIQPLKDVGMELNYKMSVEEFEKDQDDNYHVDFIYAMANLRASNYNLELMDWLTVKIKAGNIIPALATTTAAIAGLQTLEMIKVVKNLKIESHKNSFLNLAVPSLMMSEPGAPIKKKIKEGLETDLWTRWEMNECPLDITLDEVLTYFENLHSLSFRDVFIGSTPLFLH